MGNKQHKQLISRQTKHFGCIPDIPDQRDEYIYIPEEIKYYKKVNLLPFFNIDYQQKNISMCTACSVLYAYNYSMKKNTLFSPQFLYYFSRQLSGTTNYDSGSSIRDTLKSLNIMGVCESEYYPYDPIFLKESPGENACSRAEFNKVPIDYKRIKKDISEFLKCLSLKIPIIINYSVYESFNDKSVSESGIIKIPKNEERLIGFNSSVIIGYSEKKYFLCKGNWGNNFGQQGCYWIPFEYIENFGDCWVLSSINYKKETEAKNLEFIEEKSQNDRESSLDSIDKLQTD